MAQAIDAIPTEETQGKRLTEAEGWWATQQLIPRTIYWGLHASCLLALWVGVSTGDFLLFLATFFGRMEGAVIVQ